MKEQKPLRFTYPEWRGKAATMSFDDGSKEDRTLVEIFNRYGVKGTFHLNSGRLGEKYAHIEPEEVGSLYRGHEVACHTVSHPYLERIPTSEQMRELWEDRLTLEKLSGSIVNGMSYPMGTFDDEIKASLRAAGIVYSRTVEATHRFWLPQDFLLWHPTCEQKDMEPWVEEFLNVPRWRLMDLLYIWGHGFEYKNSEDFGRMEAVCAALAADDNIWFATNGEIYRYVTALKNVVTSADGQRYQNLSAVTLFFELGENAQYSLLPGQEVCLSDL